MRTSAIPDVIDALFAQAATSLPGVTVSDGTGVTDAVGDFLMIGVESPDDTDATSAAESGQQAATFGTDRPRQEDGTVTCAALSSNGDGDQKAARDAVFAMATAVAGLCRADPSLGITGYPMLVTDYGLSQRLMQNQYEDGVEAILMFSVRFRARI
jgi:hypothetical protein